MVFILFVNVFAAFCAAENTDEKKPVCCCVFPGVIDPFSGVGVRGADVILESLLGPIFPLASDPERMRRWEIIFPDGEVTTFGFEVTGEPKRGEL